jgi:hypothetical protein
MIRRLLLLCLAVMACVPALRGTAAQPNAVSLLQDATQSVALDRLAQVSGQPDTVQGRATAVNFDALASDLMDVAVTPDRTLRVRLDRRGTTPDGSTTWSGQVVGEPLSAATFVRSGNLLQGSLRTLDAAYSLEPLNAGGTHVVREVNLQAMGEELAPRIPVQRFAADDTPPIAGDDGSTFDVLVVYTPAARSAAGGDAAMLTRINLGITETNTAYANSGIIPRLRLVGAEAINYTESGDLGLDLEAITAPSDGAMDAVHARRNALGADLVKLVVGNTAGGACGVAWLMTSSTSTNFAANAFSVTAYSCITPNYTFGHELGHNMGSNHAPEDTGGGPPYLYPYSFGYKHPGRVFRTVMAYDCPSGGCPRVLYFSNPTVQYGGLPTGTIAQHNNALSINNARNTIANWRQAVAAGNTPPTISSLMNRTTSGTPRRPQSRSPSPTRSRPPPASR